MNQAGIVSSSFPRRRRVLWPASAVLVLFLLVSCRRPPGKMEAETVSEPVQLRHHLAAGEGIKYCLVFAGVRTGEGAPFRLAGWCRLFIRAADRRPEPVFQAGMAADGYHFTTVQSLAGKELVMIWRPDWLGAWWGGRLLPQGGAEVRIMGEALEAEFGRCFLYDRRGKALQSEEGMAEFSFSVSPAAGLFFPEEAVLPGQSWKVEQDQFAPARSTFTGFTFRDGARLAVISTEAEKDGLRFQGDVLFDIEKGRIISGRSRWRLGPAPGEEMELMAAWKMIPKEEMEDELPSSAR